MVIYVEDNINNQRLLAKMLKKRGLAVELYDNAKDGFEAIKTHQPEIVFVDVHLKTRATGLDLVRWVREAGYTMPIVVVTVFNMLADRDRALAIGCDDYLSKPYSMDQLYEVLDRFMGAKK